MLPVHGSGTNSKRTDTTPCSEALRKFLDACSPWSQHKKNSPIKDLPRVSKNLAHRLFSSFREKALAKTGYKGAQVAMDWWVTSFNSPHPWTTYLSLSLARSLSRFWKLTILSKYPHNLSLSFQAVWSSGWPRHRWTFSSSAGSRSGKRIITTGCRWPSRHVQLKGNNCQLGFFVVCQYAHKCTHARTHWITFDHLQCLSSQFVATQWDNGCDAWFRRRHCWNQTRKKWNKIEKNWFFVSINVSHSADLSDVFTWIFTKLWDT